MGSDRQELALRVLCRDDEEGYWTQSTSSRVNFSLSTCRRRGLVITEHWIQFCIYEGLFPLTCTWKLHIVLIASLSDLIPCVWNQNCKQKTLASTVNKYEEAASAAAAVGKKQSSVFDLQLIAIITWCSSQFFVANITNNVTEAAACRQKQKLNPMHPRSSKTATKLNPMHPQNLAGWEGGLITRLLMRSSGRSVVVSWLIYPTFI